MFPKGKGTYFSKSTPISI